MEIKGSCRCTSAKDKIYSSSYWNDDSLTCESGFDGSPLFFICILGGIFLGLPLCAAYCAYLEKYKDGKQTNQNQGYERI